MDTLLKPALAHIRKLLWDYSIPSLPGELAEIPGMREIHDEIIAAREILAAGSSGQVDAPESRLSDLASGLCREIRSRADDVEALQESESRLKYLAAHDPLTGALNRRSFMERALEELKKNMRRNVSCGLIMMDIDHFKIFNDTYGHLAGDKALRHLVKVIEDVSRKHDFLGRYGGEEFTFFFCRADREMSKRIAERIRRAVQNRPVPLESGPVTITASFGIALSGFAGAKKAVKPEKYLELLLDNADRAMYRAKTEGRNRVALFEEGKK